MGGPIDWGSLVVVVSFVVVVVELVVVVVVVVVPIKLNSVISSYSLPSISGLFPRPNCSQQ
jgi:hypothetical protein